MTSDEKNPVDQALDLFVYAPLGFAYEAKDLLPKLAKRGKGQADLLRVATEFAWKNAEGDIETFFKSAAKAAGLVPDADDKTSSDPAPDSGNPIDGYDDMIAADIVKRLADLTAEERASVRAAELAGRGRVTILNKLDRLDAE